MIIVYGRTYESRPTGCSPLSHVYMTTDSKKFETLPPTDQMASDLKIEHADATPVVVSNDMRSPNVSTSMYSL